MIKLSNRLQKIADFVTQGARIADIGSDHGLLPVFLVQSGKSPSAVAGELNEGPFRAACRQVADAGLSAKIKIRQGDGLAVLVPGEADTVTIAGMGGSLMASILEQGRQQDKLAGVTELVLQPNVGEAEVRKWLVAHRWELVTEYILEEDGHIYEVLHAKRGENGLKDALYAPANFIVERPACEQTEWLYRMGPYLLKEASPVFEAKWRLEVQKLERIHKQISQSELHEAKRKAEQLQDEINTIKEVLACLQTVRPSSN